MGRRGGRGGGVLTFLLILLSLCVCAAGAFALHYVMTATPGAAAAPEERELEPKRFSEYDWDELAEVAQMVADAPSDEEGEALAAEWGVAVGDTRPLPLSDGRQASLTVVGIRCDQLADGSGTAGLTLMTSPISLQPMNDAASNAGGWEGSQIRSWLATEGADLLPEGLASRVRTVTKSTNNVGVTSDSASVTQTDDALWLFSLSEVCGPIDLFANEYGDQVRARTYYIDYTVYDALLSGEGEQYPLFAQKGVSCLSDSSGALALEYGGAPTSWWYRTSYPYTFTGDDAYYFYQAMETGYPSALGQADQPAGVVVGLCL
ncbi:hypothetical protein H6A07_00100 [Olsenella uli]|uniref:DUF6273 domain-containing protein n=1 Tax=Olsenella uli TaxID=133926 RepID=UPI00195ADC30|nr:DUF6273 domain-containing protein [Olsenella uli]MBM6675155.1 hypothetical protein [Olsenella uli]